MAPKIMKRRGKQLNLLVRKRSHLDLGPIRFPSTALHISFFNYNQKKYVEDSSSTSLGSEQEMTAHKTIWVDNTEFFKDRHQLDAYIRISEVLTYLKVKAYLHDFIIAPVLSAGESRYKKNGNKVKRNNFNRMFVHLTWIKTFAGDTDSVKELLEEQAVALEAEPSTTKTIDFS